MKNSTLQALTEMMEKANRPKRDDETIEAHANATFEEFQKGINHFMAEGDISTDVIAMIGAGIEMSVFGARTTEIKIGMFQLLIDMSFYAFKNEKRKFVLNKVQEKREEWKKQIDELNERTAKLATLSPDDILNAPVVNGIPNS